MGTVASSEVVPGPNCLSRASATNISTSTPVRTPTDRKIAKKPTTGSHSSFAPTHAMLSPETALDKSSVATPGGAPLVTGAVVSHCTNVVSGGIIAFLSTTECHPYANLVALPSATDTTAMSPNTFALGTDLPPTVVPLPPALSPATCHTELGSDYKH